MSRYSVSRPRLNATPNFGLLPGPWADEAACKESPWKDAWHPNDTPLANQQATEYALEVCKTCPVRAECLAFAIKVGPSGAWGIYGGTTHDQRKRMWKARGTAA